MDATTRSVLRGLHLQAIGLQASVAALEHTLRSLVSDEATETETTERPPASVANVSEEIRRAFAGPTAEEQRENVFMRRGQPVLVPPLAESETIVASGTPNGANPSDPND